MTDRDEYVSIADAIRAVEDEVRSHLPARVEDFEAVRELERQLDGRPRAMVPFEAYDIGDADERPNPRASDLDYPECGEVSVAEVGDGHVMYDAALAGDAKVVVEEGIIEDVSKLN